MHRDIEAMAAEAKRLREERKRCEIMDLIIELREHTYTGYYSWNYDLKMDQAVERVRKFLDDYG
jgi:hypothetical protein